KPVLNALNNDVNGIERVVPLFYKYQHRATISDGTNQPARHFENADKDIALVSTSPDYFKMLDYQWIAGNPHTALDAPDKIVLTSTRAKDYFPSLHPSEIIDKIIVYDDSISRRVSGVVAQLNYPNSFSAYNNEFIAIDKQDLANTQWSGKNSNDLMFIQPLKGVSTTRILEQLNAIDLKHNQEIFEKYNFKSWYEVIP